eukprot:GFYU01006032.1.p1 GENE.GFYU01006032.1~~GFYU01006032.1.p1  ORF type:complete len:342 (+),score=61.60 GFYU01006032.1:260-1285(+)
MKSIFGRSKKSNPSELVHKCLDAVKALEVSKTANSGNVDEAKLEKAQEDVGKYLSRAKNMLYGEGETEPNPELVAELVCEIQKSDLILVLTKNIEHLGFETRKDLANVFNNMIRQPKGDASGSTLEMVAENPDILFELAAGYDNPAIALNCGSMLRECIRHENLTRILLYSTQFFQFFRYVELSNFDVASDAFATFKDLLTRHKALCAEFLDKSFDEVFRAYTGMLSSNNYVTRRQSLKLLGELLLDRANFTVMTRYISNPENLKLMMTLLVDESRSIQFEAFHVFKVFVANPNKTKPIRDILMKNQEKLVRYLDGFHNDKEDDQFKDEKHLLIQEISKIQ